MPTEKLGYLSVKKAADSNALIKKYKKKLPKIEAKWDLSDDAISYNNINDDITSKGLSIYKCSLECLFKGIYEPEIYHADTLWDQKKHDNKKIAKVIQAWEEQKNLSPIFLVKHGKKDLALVSDGKHRLTVSAAIAAKEIYFMTCCTDITWIEKAFPFAKKIY